MSSAKELAEPSPSLLPTDAPSSSSLDSCASSSYCDLQHGVDQSWLDASNEQRETEWDLASTGTAGGETGPGGGHNLVPHGAIGAEFRTMKAALAHDEPMPLRGGTPQSDPYHGRTVEPRTVREPPAQSFNLMVVGEAGLGKTTLLESFFQSFKDDEANFALFERKETAVELEKRELLAEVGMARNAAERELQGAIEKQEYARAHAKQADIEQLTAQIATIGIQLKELSAADERHRNELRALRESCRALRLDTKRAADQGAFVAASERHLEAAILQSECDSVQAELKQMRRSSNASAAARTNSSRPEEDEDEEDIEEEGGGRRSHRTLNSATVSVKAFDPFCISVGKHELQVTLVDTPGYGEALHTSESFEVICDYVDNLFERQLRAESSWTPRDAERLRLQDPLVHACLYFIAPHRLKHIDIAFMRALHKKVNIVPLIGKSDTMTTKEKEEFKQEVREALQREAIEVYTFEQALVRGMEEQDRTEYKPPYAVIGSTDPHLDNGATVFLRRYPWGDALSSEPMHSDLPALRNLLMWSGQWLDLKMSTRAKYEAWRATRPLSRRSSAAIAACGRAIVAKAARAAAAGSRRLDALGAAFTAGCEVVHIPPRRARQAIVMLLLAVAVPTAPRVVRWATGTDLSAARQLSMTREQVKQLGLEKARLVEQYERSLAEARSQLHESRSQAELKGSATRAANEEKASLSRSLRAALSRAEVAEAAVAAAAHECKGWEPLVATVKSTSVKVGGWAREASETMGSTAGGMAKGAGSTLGQMVAEAPAYLREAKGAATKLFADIKSAQQEGEFTVHPVG